MTISLKSLNNSMAMGGNHTRLLSKCIDDTWGLKQLEPKIQIIGPPEDVIAASGEPHAHAMGRAFVVWC
jgi:hypothetical protein